MPEMMLSLRWPDGRETQVYSPSSIIQKYFAAGECYTLPDFLQHARIAFHHASERVREVHGFPCAAAAASLAAIELQAKTHVTTGQTIKILKVQ